MQHPNNSATTAVTEGRARIARAKRWKRLYKVISFTNMPVTLIGLVWLAWEVFQAVPDLRVPTLILCFAVALALGGRVVADQTRDVLDGR